MIFPMQRREVIAVVASTAALALLAGLPLADDGFWLALAISIASYVAMATAWALFSGPTNYVSLATAAFFGSGAYVVSALAETAPWPVVLVAAALVGALLALATGLATLRLDGFCSFRAGDTEGWLISRREPFRRPAVTLNARVGTNGCVAAEILDRHNRVLP